MGPPGGALAALSPRTSGRPTLGLMLPLPLGADGALDTIAALRLAEQAEAGGFAALWARDVPLLGPDYPDRGPFPDPWVWLGMLAGATRGVALGTAGAVLPLRHPLHVAKAAGTLGALGGGRFLLGLASGDRAEEYPAFGRDRADRAALYRDGFAAVRAALAGGDVGGGLELAPRPVPPPPMLAVGSAGQTLQWVAENADGWVSYPRDLASQRRIVGLWRQALEARAGGEPKPFLQALGVDLLPDPGAPIEPAPYGLRLGRDALARHLAELGALGVSHVILNPARGGRPVAEVAEEIAAEVLPGFAAANTSPPPRFGPIRKG